MEIPFNKIRIVGIVEATRRMLLSDEPTNSELQVQINDVPAGTDETGYRAEASYVKLKGLAEKLAKGLENK